MPLLLAPSPRPAATAAGHLVLTSSLAPPADLASSSSRTGRLLVLAARPPSPRPQPRQLVRPPSRDPLPLIHRLGERADAPPTARLQVPRAGQAQGRVGISASVAVDCAARGSRRRERRFVSSIRPRTRAPSRVFVRRSEEPRMLASRRLAARCDTLCLCFILLVVCCTAPPLSTWPSHRSKAPCAALSVVLPPLCLYVAPAHSATTPTRAGPPPHLARPRVRPHRRLLVLVRARSPSSSSRFGVPPRAR